MRAAGLAVLLAAEGVLFALPLVPALDELRRKRDATPLEVVQKHAGDIKYFAHVFRDYVAPLKERLRECTRTRTTGRGWLKNGEEYVLLGDDRQPLLKALGFEGSTCRQLIAAGVDVALPNDLRFAKEIYAARSLMGGERNSFRAILCDENIHFGRHSETMRWAHAGGQLEADSGCRLYGRISSDREIVLAPGCTFQRLHAPRIRMGPARSKLCDAADGGGGGEAKEAKAVFTRRLVDGDLDIRAGEIVGENVVVRGTLHIGAGARVRGSVKGHRSVVVEENVEVQGSLISSGELRISSGCRIGGPVLAEHQVEIAGGSVCGSPESPTTVSSPVVEAMDGSVFFGTVWAREVGRVVAQS